MSEGPLLAIDPGITRVNPTGFVIFDSYGLRFQALIYPVGKGPAERAMSVIDKLYYYLYRFSCTEIACEEIVRWAGRRNMEGLIVLTREIAALAGKLGLPVAFYTPSEWHGRLPREVWQLMIRQEFALPEDISGHVLAAVGIAAYHLKRMEILRLGKG